MGLKVVLVSTEVASVPGPCEISATPAGCAIWVACGVLPREGGLAGGGLLDSALSGAEAEGEGIEQPLGLRVVGRARNRVAHFARQRQARLYLWVLQHLLLILFCAHPVDAHAVLGRAGHRSVEHHSRLVGGAAVCRPRRLNGNHVRPAVAEVLDLCIVHHAAVAAAGAVCDVHVVIASAIGRAKHGSVGDVTEQVAVIRTTPAKGRAKHGVVQSS
eukprot:scaffold7779_cov62-Phaeocystis_antarctica.AAC.8